MPRQVLFITTDEEMSPNIGWTPEIYRFLTNLEGWSKFYNPPKGYKSTLFEKHRTASTACSPSRATLYSGRYPHGPHDAFLHQYMRGGRHDILHVDGIGKSTDLMVPLTGPQMGSIFEEAGFKERHYVGKFHLAPNPTPEILSNVYRWNSWQGNEPHGSDLSLRGELKDEEYLDISMKVLDRINPQDDFVMCVNFVNPHDINLFLKIVSDGYLPDNLLPFTQEELRSFRDYLAPMFPSQEIWRRHISDHVFCDPDVYRLLMDHVTYRKFYLYCLQKVDRLVSTLINHAQKMFPDILIVRTTDHGTDLNMYSEGTHMGLVGKWMTSNDTTLRIPFGILYPSYISSMPHRYTGLSSSVDVLPTILGLCGIQISEKWGLSGYDLTRELRSSFLFVSYDNPTEGDRQYRIAEYLLGHKVPYETVPFYRIACVIQGGVKTIYWWTTCKVQPDYIHHVDPETDMHIKSLL